MKIQTLKIHNIASIENAQINFDKYPLADDPLFLITGETGSGKTTILNAICLALYNQVPALKSIGTAEMDKEGLQTNNPRQLLRRGTGEAEIELSFIGNDKKQYRAIWQVQRAHKKITGKYQNIVRILFVKENDTEITYTKKDEIENHIKLAIGLTFDQFTRTTLLAQGQFASFMKASDNEKSEILEKLTGTEIYAQIGQQVFALMQKATDDFKAIDNQIQGATLLNEEEKSAMQQKIAELAEQIKLADNELKKLDTQIAWINDATKLNATLTEKIREQQEAKSAIDSDDYREKKVLVADWEKTTEIRDILTKELAETKELAILEQELEKLTATFRRIYNGIEWQKISLKNALCDKDRLDKTLDSEAENAEMYANAGQLKVLANNVTEFIDEIKRYNNDKNHIDEEIKRSLKREEILQVAQNEVVNKFEVLESLVKKQETEIGTIDLSAMTRKVKETADEILKTNNCIAGIKHWLQAKTEWEEANHLLNEVLEEQTVQQKVLEENKTKLPALELDFASKHGYLEGQMQLNDHIRELRLRFNEQKICPLCGNSDAHLHNDEKLDMHLSEAKEQEAKAKYVLEKTNRIIAKTEVKLKTLSSTIISRKAETNTKQKNMELAKTEVQVLFPNYVADEAISSLETSLYMLNEQREREQQALDNATEQHKSLENSRKSLEKLRKEKDDAKNKLSQQTQKTNEQKQHSATLSGLIENSKAKADNALDEMSKLLAAGTVVTFENVKELSVDIERRAKIFGENQRKSQNLAAALESQRNQINANELAFSVMKKRFSLEFADEPREVRNLETEISSFVTKVNNIDGGIEQTAKRLKALRFNSEKYFSTNNKYSKEKVLKLNSMSRETINAHKASLEKAEKHLAETNAAVSTINEQLVSLSKNRPQMNEDATAEYLLTEKTHKVKDRENANNELVALRTQLEKDKELAVSLEEKYRKREQLRKEKNNWEILDRAFGGADGKKFRNIAQSYVLRALLNRANQYLMKLNNRYQLDCEDGSLTINVIDKHQGDAVRNVGLLSGGEGFVVSLALALGLSAISSSNLNVDTLFIDEGFGTLSSDYLETVINTLDRLHQNGGRRVGIISHVDGLKERIPTQICLKRTGPSSSEIEVVSL